METTSVTHVSYDTVKQRFKSCEKDIPKQIQIAKSNYFNRIFTAYRTDMKKTWRTINETLSRNKNVICHPVLYIMVGLWQIPKK